MVIEICRGDNKVDNKAGRQEERHVLSGEALGTGAEQPGEKRPGGVPTALCIYLRRGSRGNIGFAPGKQW